MAQHAERLLIVSSDLEVLHALSQALTANGRTVASASDWGQATALIASEPLSMMLYDVKELDLREWKRLAALRSACPQLAVVLLASLESSELGRGRQERLIADYLMKPIRLPELEACLSRLAVH